MHNTYTTIFEDNYLLIVNKPALLHSTKGAEESSLAEEILKKYPTLVHASQRPEDGGLVNRLDYETSGLVLVAKTRYIWDQLFEALKKHQIHKEYLALVEGQVKRFLYLDGFLGSRHRGSKKVSYSNYETPRCLAFETEITPVAFYPETQQTLVRAVAHRAARHQIRLSCAHLGHPLVADSLYGAQAQTAIPHFVLHAEKIKFTHPETKKVIEFESALPAYSFLPSVSVPVKA